MIVKWLLRTDYQYQDMPISKNKILFNQDDVIEYVIMYGKLPKHARFRFSGWGKMVGIPCQKMQGTITFHVKIPSTGDWVEESYYAVDVTMRNRFMNRMLKKTENLKTEQYFTWQPEFYGES